MAKKVRPGKLRGRTHPNKLTKDENDYILSILGGMSYNLSDLAQLVVKSGVTTLREEELIDAFNLIAEKGIEMGLQGNNINFGYFLLRFLVKGVFNSPNEPFMRPKHEVTASMSVTDIVIEAMKATMVENMGPAQAGAQMDTLINTLNGEVNLSLTGGQVLEVKGVNLSIAGDAPSVGIYLQEDGAADSTRIKIVTLLNNEPKRLMFMVPLSVTINKNYRIVHISQAGTGNNTKQLKEPRVEYSMLLKCTDGTPITDEGGGGSRPEIE